MLIQKVVRGFLIRKQYMRMKSGSVVIQKTWRGHHERKKYKRVSNNLPSIAFSYRFIDVVGGRITEWWDLVECHFKLYDPPPCFYQFSLVSHITPPQKDYLGCPPLPSKLSYTSYVKYFFISEFHSPTPIQVRILIFPPFLLCSEIKGEL